MTSRRFGIYGTGRLAAQVIDALNAGDHQLTAAIAYLPEEGGRDIGTLTGGPPLHVVTTTDLESSIETVDLDVLIYCGMSGPILDRTIDACADNGVDLVHANFVHPRIVLSPDRFEKINDRAAVTGARIVGTGMLPGFWLDVLPSLLTSTLPAPVSIEGVSCADISSWGSGVLSDELGIGEEPREHRNTMGDMLRQSATMIADVLGIDAADVAASGGPLTATEPFTVAGIEVVPGECIGFSRAATIEVSGKPRVRVSWTGMPGGYQDYRSSLVVTATGGDGTQIRIETTRPTDPYPGTAARLIHAARSVTGLPGGLHTTIALGI